MKDLDNLKYLASFENENTTLDFKGAQYRKEQYSDFIKDICAFANSRSIEEKFIIIGVINNSDGTREFRSILEEEVIDQSVFQKLILEHISPDVQLEMLPFEHEGYQLVCFRIYNCNQRPYLIKKEYNSNKGDKSKILCLGQGWIRKGDTNFPLTRDDLEEIYNQKASEKIKFSDKVNLIFPETGSSEITLNPIIVHDLPSDAAKKRIENILQKRKEDELKTQKALIHPSDPYQIIQSQLIDTLYQIPTFNFTNLYQSLGMGVPYDERSTSELQDILSEINKVYRKQDLYELFQNHAYHLNFFIVNNGPTFLKNVTIIFRIATRHGFFVFSDEPEEPSDGLYSKIMPRIDNITHFYPDISVSNNYYIIEHQLKQVRHNIPEEVFRIPPRFLINDTIGPEPISIEWELHAENNPEPITGNLLIYVSKEHQREIQNEK